MEAALAVASIACSLPFVYLIVAKPELRSLAFRNTRRRPGQSMLVVSGVLIATAMVTSAGVVGDSLRASVRQSAVTRLGPVDEEVLTTGIAAGSAVRSLIERSSVGRSVGTLPLLSLSTTVVGRDFVARVAQAQILEVDFANAERFGGDAAATGINGPTPSGNRAVIGADLAAWTAIAPGHRMTVEAFGVSRTFTIDRVLPRRGVAGLAPVAQTTGSLSLNLFVPPGTIASMLRAARGATGQALPVSVVAISNGNRRPYDPQESALVSARLRQATTGAPVQVQPVKQLLLADAAARSRRFTALFRSFGLFSTLAGILLLALTVLTLARDRSRSMGILRANGLRRSRQVAALSLEGWLYALVGAAFGGLAGLGVAQLVVVLARNVFASQAVGRFELVFAARTSSVALGCAVGFLAALVVVVCAAQMASRRNIVRMIRRQADPPRELPAASRRLVGGAFGTVGIVILVAGLVASNGVASVAGPAIAAIGGVMLVDAPARTRLAISIAAVAVFTWSAVAVTLIGGALTSLSLPALATEGVAMSASAVALFSVNHHAFTRRWSEPRGRRGLWVGLGIAYSRSGPRRTSLIVGMYTIVIFTVTLLVTIGHLYNHNVAAVAHSLGGAAALEVTSDATRPVPPRDVAQMPGVTRVTPTSTIDAQLQDGPSSTPVTVTVVGFGRSFVGHGSPPVVGAPDTRVFTSVAGDPTRVIVGVDLRSDLQSGLPGAPVRVGNTINLRNPLTGATRTLTVGALVEQARWDGANHVYTSRAVIDQLSRGPTPGNLLYVETSPGTNNDVVAAIVDGTHLRNGSYARSFQRLAHDTLAAQQQFLDIAAGYATVGLLAALTGFAVVMVDRIRDRRRQIAMLRALGFRGRTVRRAFRVEAALMATEGIFSGLVVGVVLARQLASSGVLGSHLSFSLPIVTFAEIATLTMAASLVATSVPTRRAGRLQPASTLRSEA